MSEIIKIFNEASLIIKIIFLIAIVLHIFIIVKSIKRKPIEGITKGKVWITYLVGYYLIGYIGAGVLGAVILFLLQSIAYVLKGFNFNYPTEITIMAICYVILFITAAIIFTLLNKKYLTSESNIGREENTTTKKYILLLLKFIGIGILTIYAIPLVLLFIAGYVVFKVLGIGHFIGNKAVDRYTEVQDNIDIQTYERQRYGNRQQYERIITDSEANEIKERIEKRNLNN